MPKAADSTSCRPTARIVKGGSTITPIYGLLLRAAPAHHA